MANRTEAAEWSILPSIGAKGVYNDNLILTPFPHEATYGYWVSPAAEFAGKTERLEVSGRVASDFVTYFGGQEDRFTNIFLPLTARYKTETDLWGVTGGFIRDNTLMAELEATGVVLRFTQRNQFTANPMWTRTLTEKFSFQTSFQFNETTYEDGLRLGLVDYQLSGGAGAILYQVTEQTQLQLAATYVNFHTTNAPLGFRAGFPGVNASFTHAFTESMTGTIYGGPRFLSSTSEVGGGERLKTNDTVWLFGASVSKKFESATIQASLSRDIIPSGFGLLIQTDRIGAVVSHDVNERLQFSIDASGYQVSGATSRALPGVFLDQSYAVVTPKVSWKFLEWWKAELSYTYRWRDAVGTQGSADSNGTMLTITYFPPKLALSN
jgi:hypothetical protein